MAKRIGVETMDTAAACRTYNILASEGRQRGQQPFWSSRRVTAWARSEAISG